MSNNMYSSTINTTQMSILEARFANNPFLNETALMKLAQDTGLDKQRIHTVGWVLFAKVY